MQGNQYKNKRVLMEAIHKMKAEKVREKQVAAEAEARKSKSAVVKTRKDAKGKLSYVRFEQVVYR